MRHALISAIVLSALALPLPASGKMWTYKNWWINADGGKCEARTGREGWYYLEVRANRSGPKPPKRYPLVTFSTVGIRGVAPSIKDGETVRFVVDSGLSLTARGVVRAHDPGIYTGEADIAPRDRQRLLKAMRHGRYVDIFKGRERLLRASLSGFTAAYGKMAEQCRFSTVGVIK